MTKKPEWQVVRDKRIAAQAKAMEQLTDQQKEAIDKAYEALRSVTVTVSDIQDIYLSDIRKVETALWSMYHAFNKEDKE